jgi:integral membrane sensor domain MASE1
MQHANSQNLGLRVAGVLFSLIAIGHLIRLLMHPVVMVGSYHFPMWSSVVSLVFFACLAVWMFVLARPKHYQRAEPPRP